MTNEIFKYSNKRKKLLFQTYVHLVAGCINLNVYSSGKTHHCLANLNKGYLKTSKVQPQAHICGHATQKRIKKIENINDRFDIREKISFLWREESSCGRQLSSCGIFFFS